jgi:sterol desaturase/sphingolipid hydroxylase (fatty acid hydroxylase superfamily)
MAARNDDPRAPGLTLREASRIFWRRPSPRIFVGVLAHAILWRIFAGPLSIWDAVVVGLVLALHPLTEWVIHVFILHFRPRRLGRFTLDFRAAKDHRDHHRAPHDARFWFIPIQSHVTGFVGLFVLANLLLPRPLAATLIVAAVAVGLVYEWTHYLCHSRYRPRSEFVAARVKHHRLHHFKNERYWMGVTLHGGDAILGTNPRQGDVETSPTCRSLLGDEEV